MSSELLYTLKLRHSVVFCRRQGNSVYSAGFSRTKGISRRSSGLFPRVPWNTCKYISTTTTTPTLLQHLYSACGPLEQHPYNTCPLSKSNQIKSALFVNRRILTELSQVHSTLSYIPLPPPGGSACYYHAQTGIKLTNQTQTTSVLLC